MGNGRAFKRRISGAGETARYLKKQNKQAWKSINRPHGSARVKPCYEHGEHRQLWDSSKMSWINEESFEENSVE